MALSSSRFENSDKSVWPTHWHMTPRTRTQRYTSDYGNSEKRWTLQRDTNDVHSLLLQYCLPTPLLYYQASLSLSLSSLYPFQRRFVRSLSLFPAVHYLEHLRRAPYHVSFGWTIDEQSATRSSSVSRPLTITLRDGS